MRWVKAILRLIVSVILMIVCAVLFYVLVIMGDTTKVDGQSIGAMPKKIVLAQSGEPLRQHAFSDLYEA